MIYPKYEIKITFYEGTKECIYYYRVGPLSQLAQLQHLGLASTELKEAFNKVDETFKLAQSTGDLEPHKEAAAEFARLISDYDYGRKKGGD